MPYQRISVTDKRRLFECFTRGNDYLLLARTLGIKRTTAWAIIKRAQDNEGELRRPRGGARPQRERINEEITAAAVGIIEGHPDFTLEQINVEIRRRLPQQPVISRSSLARLLDGQLIFMKKLEDSIEYRNVDRVKENRRQFANWLLHEGIHKDLIFMDEAGVNLYCKRTRGRARRGERAVRVVGGRRGRNLTMTFAISQVNGVVHHRLQEGGMNGDGFIAFLNSVIEALPDDGHQRVFIFDNAPAHRRAAEANLPQTIELRWLPPYSPFLNIVENAISQWKAAVKGDLAVGRDHFLLAPHEERIATVAQIAEQNVEVITPQNAAGYFRHLQTYLPPCLLFQDILM